MSDRTDGLEQQLRARMDALAGADPLCNRIMGQLEILKEQEQENEPPELSIEDE